MPEQLSLFDAPRNIVPRDTHVVKAEQPRLTGQNAAILERLRRGPATNRELAQIALKYSSRTSDLRAAGYKVSCERLEGGLTLYRLDTN